MVIHLHLQCLECGEDGQWWQRLQFVTIDMKFLKPWQLEQNVLKVGEVEARAKVELCQVRLISYVSRDWNGHLNRTIPSHSE
jgi:hypothetical protein